jgi:hypothetical protein
LHFEQTSKRINPKMPSKKAKQLWQTFETSQNIADFFNYYSNEVWERQKAAAMLPPNSSKVDERGFTNDLVYQLAQLIDEAATGRDLEIVIEIADNQYLVFHCQAKRLYVTHNKPDPLKDCYEMLNHKVEKTKVLQIDTLLSSIQAGAYPIYLLHNFTTYKKMLSPNYPEIEMFGCSIISANYLYEQFYGKKSLATLRFQDLHEPAKPLASLTQIGNKNHLNIWGNSNAIQQVHTYNYQAIFDSPFWDKELNPPTTFRFTNSLQWRDLVRESIEESPFFNPKFRIIFTKQPIYRRKRNFSL